MVCTPSSHTASIAGGFIHVPAGALAAVWLACRRRPLGIGDFRVWLATHEIVTRRGRVDDRIPAYGFAELARLSHVTERRACASVRRLVTAGLLEWSGSVIGFPPLPHPEGSWSDTIGKGSGLLAIPRRLLRYLCGGTSAAMIAVALGALLRCLSRRRHGWDGRGRFKASWVAETFGVGIRQVRVARRALVELGWLVFEDSNQWAMNRWGRAYRIDLDWKPPISGRTAGPRSAPLPADPGSRSAPPDSDPDPLSGERNQEPGLPTEKPGVEPKAGKGSRREPSPTMLVPAVSSHACRRSPMTTRLAPDTHRSGMGGQSQTMSTLLPAPTLNDVRPEDLRDIVRTLALYDQAVGRGLVGPSEGDRLKFLALAEHARVVGTVNSGGLLASLVRRGAWAFATQGEEDAARHRLREHLHGRPRSPEPATQKPRVSTFVPDRPALGPSSLGDLMVRLGAARGLG